MVCMDLDFQVVHDTIRTDFKSFMKHAFILYIYFISVNLNAGPEFIVFGDFHREVSYDLFIFKNINSLIIIFLHECTVIF